MAAPVIDYRSISWVLGTFLGVLAVSMLVPTGYALFTDESGLTGLWRSAGLTTLAALVLLLLGYHRPRRELRQREAILLVVLVWLGVCGFGSLPFYYAPQFPTFTDALFEATSGFTTTGATVLAQVEGLSRPLHLWRSFSHWLGGMGIVLLGLAIMPLLSQGGSSLYKAEFSGAETERLRPRVVETVRALWKIYLILTLAEFLCLLFAGMDAFEAICHAFSTLGTGGFSTRTASVGAFGNPLVEYIVIIFMLLAGISFVQHFHLWVERDPSLVFADYEVRAYFATAAAATVLITVALLSDQGARLDLAWEPAFRAALFQVSSILTTTGFVTTDYDVWPSVAQLTLVLLMFIGGCTGSTAGGLKVARIVLVLHVVQRHFRQVTEPQGVFRIHINGTVIPEAAVSGLINLVFLAALLLFLASLAIAATGVDLLTAVTAVAACQFNVGPGLAGVGPAANYGGMTALAKWILSFCMIAGRLEFYTLLVLLTSAFWQR